MFVIESCLKSVFFVLFRFFSLFEKNIDCDDLIGTSNSTNWKILNDELSERTQLLKL